MSVVVFVTRPPEATALVHWGAFLGRARGEDVVVVAAAHASGRPGPTAALPGVAIARHRHRRKQPWARRAWITRFVLAARAAIPLALWRASRAH